MSDVHAKTDSFDDDEPTQVMSPPCSRSGPPGEIGVSTPTLAEDLDFVLGRAPDRKTVSDQGSASMLEVHQTWGGTLLDTVHRRSGQVTAGEATGYRWRVLGAEIAWVPRPLAMVLPFAPPMLSEVDTRPVADLSLSGPCIPAAGLLPVFVQHAGAWEARIREGWEAVLDADGVLTALDELIEQGRARKTADGSLAVAVPDGGQLTVGIGEVHLHARLVPASRKPPAGSWLDRIDLVFLGLVALMAVLGACFGLLIAALPGAPEATATDLRHWAEVVSPTMMETPPEEARSDMGASEERAKRDEGRKGEREAKREVAGGDQAPKSDREVANEAGLMGVFAELGANEGMGGTMDSSMLEGLGVFHGKGVAMGTDGLGARGDRLGGGGTIHGIGGIGIGCPPGARCKGVGTGPGVGTWKKATNRITTIAEDPLVVGNVDKAAIDKVIKRNLPKFKYCYQRQLQRTPNLSGKVVNRFVIAKDGSVSKSDTKSSSMGSPDVDSCIIKTMSRLNFPPPKGGGIAIISYPFVFSAN